MANEADERIERLRRAVLAALYKGTQLIAIESAEKFAPKGPTLQLSTGIQALQPYFNAAGEAVGIIISSAKSRSGYNYAAKQHDEKLRHVTNFPLLSWYGDGQQGDTNEKRYAKGYRLHKDSSPKFATEYLTKGLESKEKLVLSLIDGAVRAA